jgi:succinate dehydrogenase/fumarate reductase flavoprotein subunit
MAVDVLVLGAGAGGMTAAAAAAALGLRVLLCEATEQVGGTTATSAGTVWVPLNDHAREAGVEDSRASARAYLRALVEGADDGRLDAFLDTGAAALRFLESNTELRFTLVPRHPDYRQEAPGAVLGGRALACVPYDGRLLGAEFRRIRAPREEFLVLGGMMVGKDDIAPLVEPLSSWHSFRHCMALLGRYAMDRLRYPRGTRLVMGNALVARLYASLRSRAVEVRFATHATRLLLEGGRVVGAEITGPAGSERVDARRGVVLACGGVGSAAPHPLAFERNRGDGVALARACGARLETDHPSAAFWMPVSIYPGRDGRPHAYPHIMLDRAKPGVIAVGQDGERFTNEARSYHDFVLAMKERERVQGAAFRCFLLCDAAALRKYGLGAVRPRAPRLAPYLQSGYLRSARDLAGLAAALSIPAATLERAVARFNADAARGVDTAFGRGASEFDRHNGDAAHAPNPCLAPLETAPYYAVELQHADLAPSVGLETDADAHVLDDGHKPIEGLYACGNEMASIMRGAYPGPGITLGPALVFAYRAACHMAGRPALAT